MNATNARKKLEELHRILSMSKADVETWLHEQNNGVGDGRYTYAYLVGWARATVREILDTDLRKRTRPR